MYWHTGPCALLHPTWSSCIVICVLVYSVLCIASPCLVYTHTYLGVYANGNSSSQCLASANTTFLLGNILLCLNGARVSCSDVFLSLYTLHKHFKNMITMAYHSRIISQGHKYLFVIPCSPKTCRCWPLLILLSQSSLTPPANGVVGARTGHAIAELSPGSSP
jgi:hypothetical protein